VIDGLRRLTGSYAGRVAGVSVLGAAGRLAFLGHQPLWRDEAFSAIVVRQPVGRMLDAVRVDSAPPLAYLLNHVAAPLWPGPSGLRVMSALGGAAAIPVGAALGRRLGGDRTGLITALLMAIAPAFVMSARDARMYALATTLVLAATLVLWRAVERPSATRWTAYGALTTLALYTSYFAGIAVLAQLIAVGVVLRPGMRRWLTAAAVACCAGLLLVPWLIAARAQFTHASAPFWVAPVSFRSTGGELVQMLAGPPVDTWVPALKALWTLQGLAVAASVGGAVVLVVRWRSLRPAQHRAALYCAVCGGGAILLFFPLSLWRPLIDGRYASVVWGPLFPLLGAGLALVKARSILALLLASAAAASAALCVTVTHPETPLAAAVLDRRLASSDLVDAYPSQFLLLLYYSDRFVATRTHVVSRHVDWFWGTAAYPPGAVLPAVPSRVTREGAAVYYVSQPDDPAPPPSVAPGYRRSAIRCWTGVCVTTYSRPAR
jgi:4-amino-4-deoxy-L-arabinose transferase-like glycosyltransferase